MSPKKWLVIVAAVLIAGLAFSNIAVAATSGTGTGSGNPVVAGICGLGLHIGSTVRDAGGRLADVVASATGADVADVQSQRQAGESFSSIAAESGVSADEIVDNALAVRKAALDEAVAAGSITQEQADAALSQMESRLTERVESTAPGCGGAGQGRGRGMGRSAGAGCGARSGVAPTN